MALVNRHRLETRSQPQLVSSPQPATLEQAFGVAAVAVGSVVGVALAVAQ